VNPEPNMKVLASGLAHVAWQRQKAMRAVTAAVDPLL